MYTNTNKSVEFNSPVVKLNTIGGFPFSFGVEKAKAILSNIDKIQAFVVANGTAKTNSFAKTTATKQVKNDVDVSQEVASIVAEVLTATKASIVAEVLKRIG